LAGDVLSPTQSSVNVELGPPNYFKQFQRSNLSIRSSSILEEEGKQSTFISSSNDSIDSYENEINSELRLSTFGSFSCDSSRLGKNLMSARTNVLRDNIVKDFISIDKYSLHHIKIPEFLVNDFKMFDRFLGDIERQVSIDKIISERDKDSPIKISPISAYELAMNNRDIFEEKWIHFLDLESKLQNLFYEEDDYSLTTKLI